MNCSGIIPTGDGRRDVLQIQRSVRLIVIVHAPLSPRTCILPTDNRR